MKERRRKKTAVPELTHREAAEYLLDYSLGRLSPVMNAAVEAHVRTCDTCQRQGLRHTPSDRKGIVRKLSRVRPARRRYISRRGQIIILVLAVIATAQLGIYRLVHSSQGDSATFSILPSSSVSSASHTVTLKPALTFGSDSEDAEAIAISPDGKLIAGAVRTASGSTVIVWKLADASVSARLHWSATDLPGVLAWSPDGRKLAASDGTTIGIWTLPQQALIWTQTLPASPAVGVFDASAGTMVTTMNPAKAFSNGSLLLWGADGHLSAAPAGAAGANGIAAPGTPLVGLWQASGSHVFRAADGSLNIGFSQDDLAAHHALVAWSPDGQYVLWAEVRQPIAEPSGTPSSNASATGVAPPDATVADAITSLNSASSGDLLTWFAPDGTRLLICNRAHSHAALKTQEISSGNVIATVPEICDGLSVSSTAWLPNGTGFVVAISGHPLEEYTLQRG